MVKIRLHLSFIDRVGSNELEVPPGAIDTLPEFLAIHGIRSDEIGMAIADGRWKVPRDIVIDEYSVIEVFPHLEGG
jgi:hypothetical protein